MGRLIDADELIEAMRKTEEEYEMSMLSTSWWTSLNVIEVQPTAYDVDKVVSELEQQAEIYRHRGFEHEQKGFSNYADRYYGKQHSYLNAIDIVRKGGVE